MLEASEVGSTIGNTVDAISEDAVNDVPSTSDSSGSTATPGSAVPETVATDESNLELGITLPSTVESETLVGKAVIVSIEAASAAQDPASPARSATPIATETGTVSVASTPETASAASPTTPAVSSMYSRMMAMKLGASPAAAATSIASNAGGSVNSSTKSVQSVDTLMSESYKPPTESLNSAAYPPQPPV